LKRQQERYLVLLAARLRSIFNSDATEIIVPFEIDFPEEGTIVTVPKAAIKTVAYTVGKERELFREN